jgi:hypothetical protein
LTIIISSELIVGLIRDGRIRGKLVGTVKENAIFYPKIYTDAQTKYIESFFAQNSYLGDEVFADSISKKFFSVFPYRIFSRTQSWRFRS